MTDTIDVELPGTGCAILDGAAQLVFAEEFRRAFGRRMMAWWSADPDALAEAFPADD